MHGFGLPQILGVYISRHRNMLVAKAFLKSLRNCKEVSYFDLDADNKEFMDKEYAIRGIKCPPECEKIVIEG